MFKRRIRTLILASIALLLFIIGAVFFLVFANKKDDFVGFNGSAFSLQHPKYLSEETLENKSVRFSTIDKSKPIRNLIVRESIFPGSIKTLYGYENYIKTQNARIEKLSTVTRLTTISGKGVLITQNNGQPLVKRVFLVQEGRPWLIVFIFNQTSEDQKEDLVSTIVKSFEVKVSNE